MLVGVMYELPSPKDLASAPSAQLTAWHPPPTFAAGPEAQTGGGRTGADAGVSWAIAAVGE